MLFQQRVKGLPLGGETDIFERDLFAEFFAQHFGDLFFAHGLQLNSLHAFGAGGHGGIGGFSGGEVDGLVVEVQNQCDNAGDQTENEAAAVKDQNSRVDFVRGGFADTFRAEKSTAAGENQCADGGEK